MAVSAGITNDSSDTSESKTEINYSFLVNLWTLNFQGQPAYLLNLETGYNRPILHEGEE